MFHRLHHHSRCLTSAWEGVQWIPSQVKYSPLLLLFVVCCCCLLFVVVIVFVVVVVVVVVVCQRRGKPACQVS